jgi:hypothetical protein
MQVTEQPPTEKPPHIRPNHYLGLFGLRAEKIIFDYDLAYFPGAAVKYIIRAGNKPGVSKSEDYEKAIDSIDLTLEGPVTPRTGRTTFIEQTGSYIHLNAVRMNEITRNFKMPMDIVVQLWSILEEIETTGKIPNAPLEGLREAVQDQLSDLRSNTAEVCS